MICSISAAGTKGPLVYVVTRLHAAMIKALAVAAASVVLSQPTEGFDPKTGTTYVFDITSCGQFSQDRKMPGPSSADKLYVAGWLSAYNALVPGADISGDFRLDDTLLWLDSYCHDHPFDTMQAGLSSFARTVAPSLSNSN
jgi:hypothetical protein